jgi:hypothetical protein
MSDEKSPPDPKPERAEKRYQSENKAAVLPRTFRQSLIIAGSSF